MLGKYVHNKLELNLHHLLILFLTLISTYLLFYNKREIWWTRNLYFIPLSLFLIIIFSLLYKFNSKFLKSLNKIFDFLGVISLEIYLLHEKIQENLFKILSNIEVIVSFNDKFYQICYIIIAVFIAF